MKIYIYRADTYCESCASRIKDGLFCNGVISGDSEAYPQGPYPNGGGEADSPQHCGACHAFLENPLTGDGYEYVCEQLAAHTFRDRGNVEILKQWAEFYKGENSLLDNAVQEWQAIRPEDWT